MEASHNKNAGMNYPPQSTNSSIMKYALCLMKTHIEDNDRRQSQVTFRPPAGIRSARRLRCTVGNHTNRANGAAMYVIPSSFKSRIRHHGPLDQRINKQP
jgi:hypothetical protein